MIQVEALEGLVHCAQMICVNGTRGKTKKERKQHDLYTSTVTCSTRHQLRVGVSSTLDSAYLSNESAVPPGTTAVQQTHEVIIILHKVSKWQSHNERIVHGFGCKSD